MITSVIVCKRSWTIRLGAEEEKKKILGAGYLHQNTNAVPFSALRTAPCSKPPVPTRPAEQRTERGSNMMIEIHHCLVSAPVEDVDCIQAVLLQGQVSVSPLRHRSQPQRVPMSCSGSRSYFRGLLPPEGDVYSTAGGRSCVLCSLPSSHGFPRVFLPITKKQSLLPVEQARTPQGEED